jgi:hypothetical protein
LAGEKERFKIAELMRRMRSILFLAILVLCLFSSLFSAQSVVFQKFEFVLFQLSWFLLSCVLVLFCFISLLTFCTDDFPLIGFLLISSGVYVLVCIPKSAADLIVLLFSITLGRGAGILLRGEGFRSKEKNFMDLRSGIKGFSVGLLTLLAFSSFWHLDTAANLYQGPRWVGLWDNPNLYGTLMSVGAVLAVGLLAESQRLKSGKENRHSEFGARKSFLYFFTTKRMLPENASGARGTLVFLLIATFATGAGLVCSYSRGGWLGAGIALLYLARSYGKLKWPYVLPVVAVLAAVFLFLWNNTPETAPWYFKRLDLGRPSAQHRLSAWRAGFQMMWDHPFGVGWNRTVAVFQEDYSPPDGGAVAITTNDYLMLGTQLGIPGLICFVTYTALCFRKIEPQAAEFGSKMACRAAALAMLVEFWFDGGLFKLPTASVFWVLLELGRENAQPKAPLCTFEPEAAGGILRRS